LWSGLPGPCLSPGHPVSPPLGPDLLPLCPQGCPTALVSPPHLSLTQLQPPSPGKCSLPLGQPSRNPPALPQDISPSPVSGCTSPLLAPLPPSRMPCSLRPQISQEGPSPPAHRTTPNSCLVPCCSPWDRLGRWTISLQQFCSSSCYVQLPWDRELQGTWGHTTGTFGELASEGSVTWNASRWHSRQQEQQ
ncbi:unnamed protein product, partial [Rangifer tarandus platyrhynchus]